MTPSPAAQVLAHAKRLHASLVVCEREALNKAGLYSRGLKLPFTVDELAAWIMERSTPPGGGIMWVCPYTRERIFLEHDPKRPGDQMTLDHIIPRAMNGQTVLSNLAITNIRTNRMKSDLHPGEFRMLWRWLEENFTRKAAFISVTKRLGQPPNYRIGRRS